MYWVDIDIIYTLAYMLSSDEKLSMDIEILVISCHACIL